MDFQGVLPSYQAAMGEELTLCDIKIVPMTRKASWRSQTYPTLLNQKEGPTHPGGKFSLEILHKSTQFQK